MPKLAKNMWTNAKKERKLNCYVIHIPKKIVIDANIDDNKNVKIYHTKLM